MATESTDPRTVLAEVDRLRSAAEKVHAVNETVGDKHDCQWTLEWRTRSVDIPEELLVKWLSLAHTVADDLESQATYLEGCVRVVVPSEEVPF